MAIVLMENYKEIARQARIKVLDLIFRAQTSHIGSNFSAIDIMAVLFEKMDLDKDRFVLSAGWKAASLYYFLYKKGRITEEELNSFCQPGSKFIGLAEPITDDLRVAGGSMGLGAAMSIGMATTRKRLNKEGRVYTLISDGELQTETMAATARNAGKRELNNLVFILDKNNFCAMGPTREVLDVDLYHLFYDWEIIEIDGHNYEKIEQALEKMYDKPLLIIANTVKGKGVKQFENNNLWHYAQIKEDDYNSALLCLNS